MSQLGLRFRDFDDAAAKPRQSLRAFQRLRKGGRPRYLTCPWNHHFWGRVRMVGTGQTSQPGLRFRDSDNVTTKPRQSLRTFSGSEKVADPDI
ncbi:MAG: hypothetical protein JO066_06625 [Verrucomicrobia bacterium]|nr:hypothetical protein [Verrucomicrobiota bacterium]MBV9298636.1 hypothetical protein [Verrucomicrobiota bacterium]